MPKLDFMLQGYVEGFEVHTAYDDDENPVDVSQMSAAELSRKLNDGELFLIFTDSQVFNYIGEPEYSIICPHRSDRSTLNHR